MAIIIGTASRNGSTSTQDFWWTLHQGKIAAHQGILSFLSGNMLYRTFFFYRSAYYHNQYLHLFYSPFHNDTSNYIIDISLNSSS